MQVQLWNQLVLPAKKKALEAAGACHYGSWLNTYWKLTCLVETEME